MTNSSIFLVAILNLKMLFNFSVQVLRFTQTNKKTVYNTQFTSLEGPKIYVLNFVFREICPKFEKITIASIQLNHLKIGIRKLYGNNLWSSFIAIFTVESAAFSLTSGFHAEILMTILKVKTSRQKICCVCKESKAMLKFSESLNPKEQFIMKI